MQQLLFIDHRMGLKPGSYNLPGTSYTALIAHEIASAVDIAPHQKPDLLILNPNTLGAGQLVAMQETEQLWKSVPIILYTDDASARELLPFGQVEAVVLKREGLEKLLEAVDEALNNVERTD